MIVVCDHAGNIGGQERTGRDTMVTAVPQVSVDIYRFATDLAYRAPDWLRTVLAASGTVLLLGATGLFVVLVAAARGRGWRHIAMALLAPVAATMAYLLSELLKGAVQQARPCQATAQVMGIVSCPQAGDWSFPSNHAVIAGTVIAAGWLLWRRLSVLVLPLALLGAASRVLVGVHYPHDVLAGLLIGGAVTAVILIAGRSLIFASARRS
ncbi:phosphatase PAP2 family protein [Streptosporangium canum]|uniref:phosphatase PAP2 family protein n=1 Tax=Streptosporangium canum TaxID=324952 RepID=UPI0036C52D18